MDRYTKIVLTVIAVALVVIAARPLLPSVLEGITPDAALAQAPPVPKYEVNVPKSLGEVHCHQQQQPGARVGGGLAHRGRRGQDAGVPEGQGPHPLAVDGSKSTAVVLPPLIDDADALARARACRRRSAARPARRRRRARPPPAPPPQRLLRVRGSPSSLTSTTRSTARWAIGNISSPTRRGASESAAMPPAGASTGSPGLRARVSASARPRARRRSPGRGRAYHAAMPPISPPPPTATSSVSSSGACAASSSPSVPWPSSVSR